MKFEVEVIRVGEMAADLLAGGHLIIFGDTPNEVLAEVCFMHTHGEICGDIEVGDTVVLGQKNFVITAIGEEALQTLAELGHCTFCFHGGTDVELPGQISLKGDEAPEALTIGDKIVIF